MSAVLYCAAIVAAWYVLLWKWWHCGAGLELAFPKQSLPRQSLNNEALALGSPR